MAAGWTDCSWGGLCIFAAFWSLCSHSLHRWYWCSVFGYQWCSGSPAQSLPVLGSAHTMLVCDFSVWMVSIAPVRGDKKLTKEFGLLKLSQEVEPCLCFLCCVRTMALCKNRLLLTHQVLWKIYMQINWFRSSAYLFVSLLTCLIIWPLLFPALSDVVVTMLVISNQ